MAIDGSGGRGNVGGKSDVVGTALADEGDTALADVGDTALVNMGSAGNLGCQGDRGGAALMRFGGSIAMPLICTARSAQLLRQ